MDTAGVKAAVESWSRKQLKKHRRTTKNKKPEKQVEKEVMVWLKLNDFSCHVVEAKATMTKHGHYRSQTVTPGFPDICGCSPTGLSVWIELKAPGRGCRPSDGQHEFLMEKINKGCFAVCVDSVSLLEQLWQGFCLHLHHRDYLKQHLKDPKPNG